MKRTEQSYTAASTGTGEKVLNVLIVLALVLVIIMTAVMTNAFRESLYTEFSPRSQLYKLENGSYGDFTVSYYSSYGNILDGKDEKEQALRCAAEYAASAFLSEAAHTAGDQQLLEQLDARMERAQAGMGIYAKEAGTILQILGR